MHLMTASLLVTILTACGGIQTESTGQAKLTEAVGEQAESKASADVQQEATSEEPVLAKVDSGKLGKSTDKELCPDPYAEDQGEGAWADASQEAESWSDDCWDQKPPKAEEPNQGDWPTQNDDPSQSKGADPGLSDG
jgi:hypothetical protein